MATSDSPDKSFLSATKLAAENTSPDQEHDFWVQEPIDGVRWNQVFPYQLVVVRKGKKRGYVPVNDWVLTLPFPPESLNYDMNFGVEGTVSQGGFVEEHNGVPTRSISFSGTLGVLPLRGTAPTRPTANFGEAIFGGTIEQVNRTAVAAQGLASDFTGQNLSFQDNLVSEAEFIGGEEFGNDVGKTTGYFQMRLMKNFFENYMNAKLKSENKDLRLALCLFKQQAVYLVTPVGALRFTQAADSPLEYRYSLNFKAWRRITLDSGNADPANQYVPAPRSPNAMARVLKGILDARDVLENARDILSAVVGDVDEQIFTPIRETSLFVKDLMGVPLSFADLPKHVLRDAKAAVVQYVAIRDQASGKPQASSKKYSDAVTGISKAGARLGATKRLPEANEVDEVDPALAALDDPDDNYDVIKTLQPGQVRISPTTVSAIQEARESARTLTRRDFEDMRLRAMRVASDFADAVGAGSEVYNATYQRASVVAAKRPSSQDYKVLFSLNKFISQLNKLSATTEIQVKRLSSVDYVAGLARQAGIAFQEPKSKFLVPFPYGHTLEQLAQQYLKDPDRWMEIATLNGLRAPYVDETGFRVPLLTTGSGNTVVVADASNLYVGQQVWLVAADTPKSGRRVTNVIKNSEDLYDVIVDGDADLDRFTVAGEAVLWSFLPDTVNSQMSLYIPSESEPVTKDYQARAVPGLDVYDQFLNSAGFDLLLTPSGDLALTPDGDCRLAVGLQNLIQEIRIRLSVPKGSLPRHPEFGLPVKVGQSVADMTAKDLAKALRAMFAGDPIFTGVQAVSVRVEGPLTKISMSVEVRGQTLPIPLTLDVRR